MPNEKLKPPTKKVTKKWSEQGSNPRLWESSPSAQTPRASNPITKSNFFKIKKKLISKFKMKPFVGFEHTTARARAQHYAIVLRNDLEKSENKIVFLKIQIFD